MRLTRWLWALAGVFALSLLACSGGGGGGSNSGTDSLRLSVAGTPADARVYLNGKLVEDPRNITLTPGTHQIRVEFTLSNGQVVFQTFTITAGVQTSLQYDLTGYQIEVTPPSVEVWVDQEVSLTAVLKNRQGAPVSANWLWRSLNPSIATVDSTGRVRGVQWGSTKVVVTDTVTGLSLEIPVVVLDFPPPPG